MSHVDETGTLSDFFVSTNKEVDTYLNSGKNKN